MASGPARTCSASSSGSRAAGSSCPRAVGRALARERPGSRPPVGAGVATPAPRTGLLHRRTSGRTAGRIGPSAAWLSYRRRMEGAAGDPGDVERPVWLAVNAIVGSGHAARPIALYGGRRGGVLEQNRRGGGPTRNGFDRAASGAVLAGGWGWRPRRGRCAPTAASPGLVLSPAVRSVLEQRVAYLALTRQESLDTRAAELRRIERDLHDGAQARLVAMGLTLDAAGRLIERPGGGTLAADRGPGRVRQGPRRAARPGARRAPAGAGRPGPGRRGPRARAGRPARPGDRFADGRPPAPVESAAYSRSASCLPTWPSTPAAQSADIDLRHSRARC